MGLRVGLDVGIASVGWCVLNTADEIILGAGVRTFQAAENPKTGASLAMPRRLARSARRRLHRRRVRMLHLRELFLSSGMIAEGQLADTFVTRTDDPTPYELRLEGLERRLTEREWARVLSQLCKRRGYKSMRLSERGDDDEGLVKSAIASNEALLRERGYRTIGEMLARDEKFAESKRNKGDYKGVVSREQLLEEIAALFAAQRRFGNQHAANELESAFVELLMWQAPITEGDELRAKVGKCSIDGVNRRIPTACYSFERFRILDKLHNVRYSLPGAPRITLDDEQRAAVVDAVFKRKTALTLAGVRKLLALPPDARFAGVRYNTRSPDDLSAENKEKLPHPRSWHEMRERVSGISEEAWTSLAEDIDLLDRIGDVLTYFKYGESVVRELRALGLDESVVEALGPLRFSGNGHLSRETLSAILPGMESGLSYSEACDAAGLHHSARRGGHRQPKLPPVPADEIRNPVVIRALTQTRKVLNAIITEFGPIEGVNIELARDLARSRDDRNQIEKRQKANRDTNESVLNSLREVFGMSNPRGLDLIKKKLWDEQGGRCVYSGTYIEPARLFSGEAGVAEVDHVLPHSRSFDDSYMNKVLVTTAENRNKRERTPFEYLGGDLERWHEFEERVRSLHLPRPKQERLLRRDFDERASAEFRDRNLNDTRYVARFLKNFIEENLEFAGESKAPVMTVNGSAVAFLRSAWALQKVRSEGDLHHALDAIVIAATTRSMVQRVSRFFSVRPLRNRDGIYTDAVTGKSIDAVRVPVPWEGFRAQVADLLEARFSNDPVADLASPDISPKPILVSRMPSRAVRGEVHKETVKRLEGRDGKGRIKSSKRVRLENLNPSLLERMVGAERDQALYDALQRRLLAHGGDGAKAFQEPFYKPTREGRQAPLVRAIRVYDDPSSGGTFVRGGFADNGAMVRTDVFERDGKFYLVPVYLKDVVAGELPQRAVVAFKSEDDWRLIDESYRFAFSLHMNDLVRLVKKTANGADVKFGYFKGTHRSGGTITIDAHDSSWKKEGVGVAQGVIAFDKFEVDVLGRHVHRVRREHRRGFSNRGDRE